MCSSWCYEDKEFHTPKHHFLTNAASASLAPPTIWAGGVAKTAFSPSKSKAANADARNILRGIKLIKIFSTQYKAGFDEYKRNFYFSFDRNKLSTCPPR